MTYMTSDEQLELWVNGTSVHNQDKDECCPDFSCCNKRMNTPVEERILFRDRPELRDSMLMMFLGKALADYNVHIAGSVKGSA